MKNQMLGLCLFSLLALATVAHAVQLPNVFVPYLEPNLSVSSAALDTSNGMVYILLIEGQETLMAYSNSNDTIDDSGPIAAILKDNIVQNSGLSGAKVDLASQLSALSAAKKEPEQKCMLYTGTDHLPCTDKETCVIAAQANPQAAVMYQADGFWEAMRDFTIKRTDLDQAIVLMQSQLNSSSMDAASARALGASMLAMRGKADAYDTQNLMLNRTDPGCQGSNGSHCFEFCPKLNWSAAGTGWMSLEDRLRDSAALLDQLSGQEQRAATLARQAAEWKNYTLHKGDRWSAAQSALTSRENEIANALSASAAGRWSDPALVKQYADWKKQANDSRRLANDGQFWKALVGQNALANGSSAILQKINANNQQVDDIQNSLQSIDKSLAALKSANANASNIEGLGQSADQLEKSITYPIAASQLPDMKNKSSKLEQLVLAQVGQITLGISHSDTNVSAQANEIVGNASANNTTKGGASAASTPSAAKTISVQLPANCPLPVGLVMVALLGAMMSVGMGRIQEED